MIIIIKKEVYKDWLSIKTCKRVPKLLSKIFKKYYELIGYEVEVLEKE